MKMTKLFRSGGSLVSAVPPEIMKVLDVDGGDNLVWFVDAQGRVVVAKANMSLFMQSVKAEACHGTN